MIGAALTPRPESTAAMLRDARELDDSAPIQCDLCIIGAGAAGITLARSFVGDPLQVCLLESGGLDYEPAIQELYRGQNVGLPYFDLDVCRLRFFGGSTNHWAGRCRPLDDLDFGPRAWVPLSGWPISRVDLDPFYREAQTICQLGAYDYRPETWLDPGQVILPFDPDKLVTRVWQFSPPTFFGEIYRDELEGAGNIDVVLHASVVDLTTGPSGVEVQSVEFATLAGKRGQVRARRYVLACGGLENPRLLLAANRQVNAGWATSTTWSAAASWSIRT